MTEKSPKTLTVSVRDLVAFSHFPPDIRLGGKALMELGRRGHVARQAKSRAAVEKTLRFEGFAEGCAIAVSGRMDLYDADANPPLIEEIKLSGETPPLAAAPEHLMQAVCYGFMLALSEGLPAVALRVSYVTPRGKVTASFEEHWTFEKLEAAFYDLLNPWVLWQKEILARRAERDATLETLPFPYPAFRPGQKEMAAQVYTAVKLRRRLYAVMPTGTGKSAAALYPALKALGQNLTEQVFCLTARGTQRQAMEKETALLEKSGLALLSVALSAKEKLCPQGDTRCDPAFCPYARGHYVRQEEALKTALRPGRWDTERILRISSQFELCPFEFSLALSELADLVICDYNYALDPQVRIRRVFDSQKPVTLLVDEAHNLFDRAREMLSGDIRVDRLKSLRLEASALHGRVGRLYRAYSKLLSLIWRKQQEGEENALEDAAVKLIDRLGESFTPGGGHLMRDLVSFVSALRRAREEESDYQVLYDPDRNLGGVRVLCLNPAPYLNFVTRRMAGCVFYSATLSPLKAMRGLLGGDSDDACLSLPSPFPREHLLTLQLPLNTRYKARPASIAPAAAAIQALCSARPGKYIAYFPSYAYLREVKSELLAGDPAINILIQAPRMDEQARLLFLQAFTRDDRPLLGLCVLGGVFAEGVDLPGSALIGAAVVGVGLPQVNPERELIRARLEETLGDGFSYAYRYPGMHKVLQAAGRLIRSEEDRGVLLLMDDRYTQRDYRELMPDHFSPHRVYNENDIASAARAFWAEADKSGGDADG